ncbi:transcriptional regulator [Alkalicoccus urumqiensis]|uniref:Transcriptional regulator n=2 Tax=Alkalicoccus urumqiensis TaxID=1548213 RepID=A0A2P6MJR6_ALKUR|nr:metalloregulator ArsR/SmtB family transcription factor [Alkalicoccus urumqiensis]PRO66513.1 transcriptional regulator [Alkalicoccus urumqiensis]
MSLPGKDTTSLPDLETYEKKFKALADQKRLHLLHLLCNDGPMCVCDIAEYIHLPQSKLSYHLKILYDAGLLDREQRGTWNYYRIRNEAMNHLLSDELCCLFREKG